MAAQERRLRIGDTHFAKAIWQEIHERPALRSKQEFRTSPTYKKRLLCKENTDGTLEVYFRTEQGVTHLQLKPELFHSAVKLVHQIIDHLLCQQPSLKQAVEYYVATQTIIGSIKDIPHAWTDPNGIAHMASMEYTLLQKSFGHTTPLHKFLTENIYTISELFAVIQDLNNLLGNKKDPIISAIVHAIASPLSTIKNGFFFREQNQPKAHDSAYRSFVSGSLGVFDLFEKLILYTNGNEAFSGDLGQIVRIVSHDNLMIESNIGAELHPTIDAKTKLEIYLIIQELIHNAIKYSIQTGPLVEERTILVREEMPINEDGHWVLSISNMSSRGVSLLDQDALFESGFRANGQTQIHGTGYGLFMVKNIVEKLGGSIRFVDPLDGYATTIQITLPASLFNLQNSHPSSPEAPASPT